MLLDDLVALVRTVKSLVKTMTKAMTKAIAL